MNRKSIKSPTEAIVNGSKVAIGDSIVVEYSSIQDYFYRDDFLIILVKIPMVLES